jgi:hypothetical protein
MYVTVSLVRGCKIILPWRMLDIQTDWTFIQLLEAVLTGDLDETPICELSGEMNSGPADRVQVPLSFIVNQCCRMYGTFVRYLYPVRYSCL